MTDQEPRPFTDDELPDVVKWCGTRYPRLAASLSELAGLRKDKERIDFLDSLDCGHVEIWYYDGNPDCPQYDVSYGGHWAEVSNGARETLRDEVDWLIRTPSEDWHRPPGMYDTVGPVRALQEWWRSWRGKSTARGKEDPSL